MAKKSPVTRFLIGTFKLVSMLVIFVGTGLFELILFDQAVNILDQARIANADTHETIDKIKKLIQIGKPLAEPIDVTTDCGSRRVTVKTHDPNLIALRELFAFCQDSRILLEEDDRECVTRYIGTACRFDTLRTCHQHLTCKSQRWMFHDVPATVDRPALAGDTH